MPRNTCTNCLSSKVECTHDIPRQKKKDTQKEYIRTLELRLELMQSLLRSMSSDRDISPIYETSSITEPSPGNFRFSSPKTLPQRTTVTTLLSSDDEDEEDLSHVFLAEHLKQLSVEAVEDRFFGRSSFFMFAKDATNIKSEHTGTTTTSIGSSLRRPLYWDLRPWEKDYTRSEGLFYMFPEDDLLQALIPTYFDKFNIFMPVLHRPTFERSFGSAQHLWDPGFGMIVLMVCAIASRYSTDSRVFLDGDTSGLSSGWCYFSQIPMHRKASMEKVTIYDLQYYCLAIIYLLGTSMPHASWHFLGLGIRYVQEKGAHRRKGKGHKPTADDEMWKRAFWCLLSIDRLMSSFLGRPCAIQEGDYDVDFPIECDDECWMPTDSNQAFTQPLGKPSIISGFVYHIKLCEILAFSLKTLYSTKKSKLLSGLTGNQWERQVVTELDSAMNSWKDSLPSHLQWDPTRQNTPFYYQSLTLHASYYYTQIQIHRPFLLKKSTLSLSSLTICTNAARSCSRLLAVALTRGVIVYPNIIMAAFASAIVLLINIWGGKQSGIGYGLTNEMNDVQICMNVLKECEKRWHIPGRLRDMLNEFGSMRDGPIQRSTVTHKRGYDTSNTPPASTIPMVSVPSISSVLPTSQVNFPFDQRKTQDPVVAHNWDLSNFLPAQMPSYPSKSAHDALGNQSLAEADFGTGPQSAFIAPIEESTLPNVDDKLLSLWLNAPTGFSVDEWDVYITGLSGL